MTMKLIVKNEEPTSSPHVAVVSQIDGPANEPDKQAVARTEIKGGESAEFWIYQGRRLEISEKKP